jgi:plasmid stabilization system protein ParE
MWEIEFRPEFHDDTIRAADWYDGKQPDLGSDFIDEVIRVLDSLAENPLLNSRRHPTKNIRWRYANRFPYRIVYEVIETERKVIVAALLHAARHDREWLKRIDR